MPYIGNDIRANEDYKIIDDISSGFNGSATSFALQVGGSAPVPFPKFESQLLISVNGVIQEPDPSGSAGFRLSGTNIVFSSAPTNGHAFFGVIYAGADYVNAGGTFPDGSTAVPSITFTTDTDTGVYRKGSGSLGFVSNTTEITNFDSNGITISSGNLILGDSSGTNDDRIKLGAGGDLEIYHDGSNSIIDNATGEFRLLGDLVRIMNGAGTKVAIETNVDNNVELYFNNAKKLETTNLGTKIIGDLFLDNPDHAGSDVQFDSSAKKLKFDDNVKANFGSGDDLSIYHDGSDSYIDESGTGDLKIRSLSGIQLQNGGEKYITCHPNAQIELYHNDSKKFETLTDGVNVTGTLKVNGSAFTGGIASVAADTSPQLGGDLESNGNDILMADNDRIKIGNSTDFQLLHNGSNSFIVNSTGFLDLQADAFRILSSGGESQAKFTANGAVELYHDNSKKLETAANGIIVQDDAPYIVIKDSDTASGNGAIGYIENQTSNGTALWKIGNTETDQNTLIINQRQNASTKFTGAISGDTWEIFGNSGHFAPCSNNTFDIGTNSRRVRNLYTNDLNLSNEGSSNDVDGTWGNYTIQEGAEDLFLINKRNGKKYKFNLTEVS